jgi:hypothetical protein
MATMANITSFDASVYASHSLRRGGCTALKNAGVPLHVIMHIGRWKSAAALLYMDFSPKELLKALQSSL